MADLSFPDRPDRPLSNPTPDAHRVLSTCLALQALAGQERGLKSLDHQCFSKLVGTRLPGFPGQQHVQTLAQFRQPTLP